MADFSLRQGNQRVFADHAGDFSPAAANDLRIGGAGTVQLQFASLANNAAVNSTKVDLGVSRARRIMVTACLEFAATPIARQTVNFYWSASPVSGAANGNPGRPDGSDGAYTGDGTGSVDESVPQMTFIGAFKCTARITPGVQIARVGILMPEDRYGQLIVVNKSGAGLHTNDIQSHVVLTDIQDTDT